MTEENDLGMIREEISLAWRLNKMAHHVALVRAPLLVAEVERLRAEVLDLEIELHVERTGECPGCRGTGIVDAAEHRCGHCDGRGVIPSPLQVERDRLTAAVARVRGECEYLTGGPHDAAARIIARALDGETER